MIQRFKRLHFTCEVPSVNGGKAQRVTCCRKRIASRKGREGRKGEQAEGAVSWDADRCEGSEPRPADSNNGKIPNNGLIVFIEGSRCRKQLVFSAPAGHGMLDFSDFEPFSTIIVGNVKSLYSSGRNT
jgi:hypothetical protein